MKIKIPKIETAFILAGGEARRMIDFTVLPDGLRKQGFSPESMHKSMIPIGEKPLLEHNILWLKRWGVKKIVIGVGYKKESIINYFGNGRKWNIRIIYTERDPGGGTGDALKQDLGQSKLLTDFFFVTNADQLTSLPLKKLSEIHFSGSNKKETIATISLVYPVFPFGKVDQDPRTYRVFGFQEKPTVKIPTNAGIYLFSKEIQFYLRGDLEKQVFPVLAKEGKIKGFLYKGFWDTVNTIKDWERINKKYAN